VTAAEGAHLRLVNDPHRGVVIVVRVIDGVLQPGMKIRLMARTGPSRSGRDLHAEGR
jgi:hypothetical protein